MHFLISHGHTRIYRDKRQDVSRGVLSHFVISALEMAVAVKIHPNKALPGNILSLFILLACLFAWHPAFSQEPLPVIQHAVETRLYQGRPEEIKAFIKKREALIKGIDSSISTLLAQKTDSVSKSVLEDALELFQGLSLQFVQIQSQLNSPITLNLHAPKVGTPPYGLPTFDKLVSFFQDLGEQLHIYNKKAELYQGKLSDIQDDLKSLLADYVKLRTQVPVSVETYLKLGQIMSLQCEYALIKIKASRMQDLIGRLEKQESECSTLLRKVFEGLKITRHDILEARNEYKEVVSESNDRQEQLDKERLRYTRRIINLEIKLNYTLAKIKDLGSGNQTSATFQKRQKYLETRIKLYEIKIKRIRQQKLALKLDTIGSQFKYDWISSYAHIPGAMGLDVLVRKWSKKLDELARYHAGLTQATADAKVMKSDLVQQLSSFTQAAGAHGKERKGNTSSLDARSNLKQAQGEINSLIADLNRNEASIDRLEKRINLIVRLIEEKASWYERLRVWSAVHFANTWEEIKAVLYYPLLTFGDTSVTLNSVLKILFLLFAGIISLRIIRNKLTKLLFQKTRLSYGTVNSITTLIYYALVALVILIALSTAGINLSQLSIILGALGVGIGFGLQTIANNFVSGLILLIDRSIKMGDFIELGDGLIGEVREITMRSAIIRTQDQEEIIVPNSEFVSGRVRTWTYSDNWRRLTIPFGVSYNSDPDQVASIALEAARGVPSTVEDPLHPLFIRFQGFGDNSLNFYLKVWIRMTELRSLHGFTSDYYFALFREFKKAGIEIPFPQRDIHLKDVSAQVVEIFKRKAGKDGSGQTDSAEGLSNRPQDNAGKTGPGTET